jgi:transposase
MAVDPSLCSREELLVLLAQQTVVIEGLRTQVAGQTVAIENLQALVVELRRRLDADSSNSSRPPSSDSPFRRPPPKGSAMPPEADGPVRKRGKQRGRGG